MRIFQNGWYRLASDAMFPRLMVGANCFRTHHISFSSTPLPSTKRHQPSNGRGRRREYSSHPRLFPPSRRGGRWFRGYWFGAHSPHPFLQAARLSSQDIQASMDGPRSPHHGLHHRLRGPVRQLSRLLASTQVGLRRALAHLLYVPTSSSLNQTNAPPQLPSGTKLNTRTSVSARAPG